MITPSETTEADHCTATDTGARGWLPIESAPKGPVAEGWTRGPLVYLLVPYDAPEWDVGFWSIGEGCWRFTGDDGPDDIEPTHWRPLPPPPQKVARSDQTTASDESRALSPLPNVPVDGRLRGAQVQSDGLEIATDTGLAESGGPTRAAESAKP